MKAPRRRLIYGTLLAVIFLGGGIGLAIAGAQPLLDGARHLQAARSLMLSDPGKSASEFRLASEELRSSVQSINDSGPLSLLSPLPPFRWYVRLAKGTIHLADGGETAARLLESYPSAEKSSDISLLLSSRSNDFFRWYGRHQQELDSLQESLSAASTELDAVPAWIVPGRRAELELLAYAARRTAETLPQARIAALEIEKAFGSGSADSKTFLLLFQNDAELRPTGGFMGSYAVIKASGGSIRGFEFGKDIYKLDRPFMEKAKLPPPPQVATITSHWAFRDSNADKGFVSDASPQIAWFYEQETGTKIDGLIYVDSTVLEDILAITGPVTLPGTSTEVTSETINRELTEQVERTYYDTDANRIEMEPKKIINQLIPVVLSEVQSSPNVIGRLLPALGAAVDRKSIQFWSAEGTLNQSLSSFLPSDAPTGSNWVKVVNSNLGGAKSSRNVEQRVAVEQKTDVLRRRLIHTLRITRKHVGTGEWPDATNRNFMSVYLPKDAVVLELPKGNGGESTLPEEWKKVVKDSDTILEPHVVAEERWLRASFWATTDIGATTEYVIRYAMPLTTENRTSLSYLKQAGAQKETLAAFDFDGSVTRNLFLRR